VPTDEGPALPGLFLLSEQRSPPFHLHGSLMYSRVVATTYPLEYALTAEEFLKIGFASDQKAELNNGVIRMMAGGSASHARVQRNIIRFLAAALRGSGCSPYGSDMGVRTHDLSVRYPDVSVFCGRDTPDNDTFKAFDDPRVVVEVLSPSTREQDFRVKLPEYRAIPSVDTILLVDPDTRAMHLVQRTGSSSWVDADIATDADVPLPSFNLTIPNAEIFARD
jgi:Uma2 family endonuclease